MGTMLSVPLSTSGMFADAGPVMQEGETVAELKAVLREKVVSCSASVGVVGLGYVGLPLARAIVDAGYHVIGFDTDPAKVDQLNAGRSYISYIPDEVIAGLRDGRRFETTGEMARVRELDVIIICLPTPLTPNREPDLSFIVRNAEAMVPYLRAGQLVVLESTTFPGTTSEVLLPILERSGQRGGESLFVAYSPEREDPGNANFTTSNIPKIVGGQDSFATELACAFYSRVVHNAVAVSSTGTAEAVKLTENIFRAVNIALVNELKLVFEAMDVDIWEVIEAAKTKPFGFMPFYPGPGLGGHCIPIDPFYLTWKAREHGIVTRFIELAGEINTAMPIYVVGRLAAALDERFRKGLNGARILVLGAAYKKNVDDIRESPALTIMEILERRGSIVSYHDPFVAEIPVTRQHKQLARRRSIALSADEIEHHDAVLVVTDHDDLDYELVMKKAQLVVDTRNVMRRRAGDGPNLVRA
ncbi:nucleotide sugar dehydrogenase [Roseomonas sp. KE2513]|uniref:nucleotide sugar dehydrogenase n=1 Tax=Roseomonas sp. KE2513 TaxID=2479202 RepID=UPI001E4BF2CC|nr:nucleotide sugar dehydrogenase [Roseomonas sp. KE2513]